MADSITVAKDKKPLSSHSETGYFGNVFTRENIAYMCLIFLMLVLYSFLKPETYSAWLQRYRSFIGLKDPESFLFVTTLILSMVTFWAVVGLFTIIEGVEASRRWILQFKIQPHVTVSSTQFRHACKVVLINQVVFNSLAGYLFHLCMLWRNYSVTDPLPPCQRIISHLICIVLFEEIGNFSSFLNACWCFD